MPNYRRLFVPGGTWFFTVNLLERGSDLLTANIDDLRDAVRLTRKRFPFDILTMVVLPDHIHAIWSLPPGDTDFPLRWRQIKIRFSKALPRTEPLSATRLRRGERGIWQRRYWEHLIRDDRDLQRHIEYCWFNPVKHGLVEHVKDWPHSSYHREMRSEPQPGDFERLLAERAKSDEQRYGERDE